MHSGGLKNHAHGYLPMNECLLTPLQAYKEVSLVFNHHGAWKAENFEISANIEVQYKDS